MALLRCLNIQVDRAYSRVVSVPTFLKKLMNITGMNVFALGHIDEVVTDLFNRLDKRVTPVPTILAKTFRSLNACRRAGEVDKVSYRVFPENYSALKEIVATPRRDDILEEKWVAIHQNLQEEDVESRQFIPATRGLAECEFSYKGDGCKKKIREISNAWNQTRRMKRLAVGPMTTPEYNEW
ncbi:hypothetical protein Gotri_026940 [Gossypium trilobum]|uniref:Uncharacterized protein n=1 Tax=Gossypium trilobum TaxID=34281 RepID=A0A7J9FKE4_9ROSI|nr:hypothetical protein [Gossypium trilobum]